MIWGPEPLLTRTAHDGMITAMKLCAFEGCGRPCYARDYCQSHYKQRQRGEELRPIQWQARFRIGGCQGPECQHAGNYGGLCWAHYHQRKEGKALRPLRRPAAPTVCIAPDCDRQAKTMGLCQAHYRQSRTGDGTLRPIHVPRYRYQNREGYVRVVDPSHPNADPYGRVLEHTKVMSEVLGRALRSDENVHHINGVRDDNRPENLELWCTSQPKGQRIEDKVSWAKEMLSRYAPEALAVKEA